MEMTTAEIFADMKTTDVPKELQEELRELFERADFVKFAKFTASDEDNAKALPVAVRFVTSTYQAEIEEQEKKEEE
jgi:ATP phosphoribosyltransferase regulatory subunit HisZ